MPGPSSTTEPAPDLVDDVLEVVRGILTDIIGPAYLLNLSIDLETSFDRDLELESIEFVLLGEQLVGRYGDRVDFSAWLATKEIDEIINLTVGDLVRFIASSLSSANGWVGPSV